jgi:DNA (cytosine-5)-methyltransferase 1
LEASLVSQDISVAGLKKGLKGERSGLWGQFKRLIKEIKPRYAIIENVANLRSNGLQEVLKDLWQIGYASEWHIISARSVGAPHLRERIWIIAYPESAGARMEDREPSSEGRFITKGRGESLLQKDRSPSNMGPGTGDAKSSNSNNFRLWKPFASEKEKQEWWSKTAFSVSHWKEAQSIVRGVDDGVSGRLDRPRKERIKQLGNAVVPQIPELIGRAIMEYEYGATKVH